MLIVNKIFRDSLRTYVRQIDSLFFCLSLFTLTQSIKLSSKFLFLGLAIALIKAIINKDLNWVKNHKVLLLINSFFFILICFLGILQGGYIEFFSSFERYYAPYLILILAPIFFTYENLIKNIPKVIIGGLLFTFFLIFLLSIIQLQMYDRVKVLEVFDVHHLYISLFILFSINHLLSQLRSTTPLIPKRFCVVLVLLMTLFLLFFKSKSAIVIGVSIFAYHLFFGLKWGKSIIVIFMSLCLGALVIFMNIFFNMYLEALDFRIRIWKVALEIIEKNPFFGNGAQNEQLLLNRQHFLNGNYDFLDSDLNSHNLYLTFLIKFGILGLTLFFTTFIMPLFKMKGELKIEYVGFLILFLSIAFIESLYNRHHGIVFCTVILYYYNANSITQTKVEV